MKIALFALSLLALPLFAKDPTINDVAWMSGCWAQVGAEKGSDEVWLRPAGGTMLGLGRTIRNQKTVAHEFMQIREVNGGLTFFANPSGQESASFRMISLTNAKVVFENREHDFPQRVIYELRGPDELVGRIEGTENGRERGIDFPMTRSACP
jgi:hypothetical protein